MPRREEPPYEQAADEAIPADDEDVHRSASVHPRFANSFMNAQSASTHAGSTAL